MQPQRGEPSDRTPINDTDQNTGKQFISSHFRGKSCRCALSIRPRPQNAQLKRVSAMGSAPEMWGQHVGLAGLAAMLDSARLGEVRSSVCSLLIHSLMG